MQENNTQVGQSTGRIETVRPETVQQPETIEIRLLDKIETIETKAVSR
ncbi:hypothetical protein [Streptomyces sp. GQFP]|nr:hypothetical protein [Streptomyces sp. GQFP]UIX31004.1 hypothetical protein LUX31_13725 [Streptomyces sp. GQFP]